jgi:ATP-dependent DNA helicase UvrD/PcrA
LKAAKDHRRALRISHFCPVKYATFGAMKRLIESGKPNWSIAILVSSKDMMLKVCNYLATSSARLKEITHDALMDPEGPSLAAVLIGGLLEGAPSNQEISKTLLTDLVGHIRGSGGGDISQANLSLTNALNQYLSTAQVRGSKRIELIRNINTLAAARIALTLSGDPTHDWVTVRDLLELATHNCLKAVAEDARFIRLLNRGTQLRDRLAEQWRLTGTYRSARRVVSDALLQEHFSTSTRIWTGVNLMTIHKSKGKEFDEVVIFEGGRIGRLLRDNPSDRDAEQARLALRVATTRARQRTTILTPEGSLGPRCLPHALHFCTNSS